MTSTVCHCPDRAPQPEFPKIAVETAGDTAGEIGVLEGPPRELLQPGQFPQQFPGTPPSTPSFPTDFPGNFRGSLCSNFGKFGLGGPVAGRGNGKTSGLLFANWNPPYASLRVWIGSWVKAWHLHDAQRCLRLFQLL